MADDDSDVSLLPVKKHGRPVLFGEVLDTKVQKFREGGGVVSVRITLAAARGILLSCNQLRRVKFGVDVELTGSGHTLF